MLGLFTLALAVATADPRPDLVELQLAGQQQQALVRVEQELALNPEGSRRIGIAYLRGHLLDVLRRYEESSEAFVRAMAAVPALQSYSRYRVAVAQDRLGHPEVAAGLIATVVAGDSHSPLVPEAVRLLDHALAEGGDCKLLSQLRAELLPRPQRRQIELARGECALRNRYPELARGLLVSLIQEDTDDEPARRAAEQLAGLVSEGEHGRVPMLIGFTLERHDDFDRAIPLLQRALGKGDALSARDTFETQFRIGLTLLGEQRFAEASLVFARLASLATTPDDRARAFYHEARAHELRGAWPAAGQKFRQAYLAQPQGAAWAALALLSALRIDWRTGSEATALPLYDKLVAVPGWRKEAARAALFLGLARAGPARRGGRPAGGRLLERPAGGAGEEGEGSGRVLPESPAGRSPSPARHRGPGAAGCRPARPRHPRRGTTARGLGASRQRLLRLAAARRGPGGPGRQPAPARSPALGRPRHGGLPAAGPGPGAAVAALEPDPHPALGAAARPRRLAAGSAGRTRPLPRDRSAARLHRRRAAREGG
jgi:tetratricopeptide (TPR) repeat protein